MLLFSCISDFWLDIRFIVLSRLASCTTKVDSILECHCTVYLGFEPKYRGMLVLCNADLKPKLKENFLNELSSMNRGNSCRTESHFIFFFLKNSPFPIFGKLGGGLLYQNSRMTFFFFFFLVLKEKTFFINHQGDYFTIYCLINLLVD